MEAPTVKVKPLEWNECNGVWTAKSIVGEYSIGHNDGWWCQLEGPIYWGLGSPEDPRSSFGPHAFMAAAQADYEARILSAIETTDLDAHIGAVLAEAAKEAERGWLEQYETAPARIRNLRPTALTALDRAKREARVEAFNAVMEAHPHGVAAVQAVFDRAPNEAERGKP